jgi:hypothetical protein
MLHIESFYFFVGKLELLSEKLSLENKRIDFSGFGVKLLLKVINFLYVDCSLEKQPSPNGTAQSS